MTRVEVVCHLTSGETLSEFATFNLSDEYDYARFCSVSLSSHLTSTTLIEENEQLEPLTLFIGRAIRHGMSARRSTSVTISDVRRIEVYVRAFGICLCSVSATGDGTRICDDGGVVVSGANTRIRLWRVVRQVLERAEATAYPHVFRLHVHLFDGIQYCCVSDLPTDLQRAYSICHSLAPVPNVTGVSDACYEKDMRRFIEMLRQSRGYPLAPDALLFYNEDDP